MRLSLRACIVAVSLCLSACAGFDMAAPDTAANKTALPVIADATDASNIDMAQGADAKTRSRLYHGAIERHARENAIPVALANAVIRIESNYNARIVHAGNYGLMQIKLATARSLGFDGTPAALLDPDTNLHFGLKYLGNAYQLAQGDLCLTIMKYQSGHRALRLTSANRLYCQKVKTLMAS